MELNDFYLNAILDEPFTNSRLRRKELMRFVKETRKSKRKVTKQCTQEKAIRFISKYQCPTCNK